MGTHEHSSTCRVAALLAASLALTAVLPLLSARVHVYDVYDRPREKERYVSDEAFIRCTHRLLLSRSINATTRDVDASPQALVIPSLILPVSLDYHDLKAFLCNLTIPVRHLVIIQNGDFAPLTRLLARLNRSADLSNSLTYLSYPNNIGYAAAVNAGLRLSLERFAVPWMLVSNTDVRFTSSLLHDVVRTANVDTLDEGRSGARRGGATNISNTAGLAHRVLSRREGGLADARPSVQGGGNAAHFYDTAREETGMTGVATRYGLIFANCVFDMSSFFVTAHHVRTVGLLDENYYPAYGEDFDYKWRSEAYGFRHYLSPCGGYVHFVNGNLNAADDPLHYRLLRNKSSWALLLKINRMNYQPFRLAYRRLKWFPRSRTMYVDDGRASQPFDGRIAVHTWAFDATRQQRIRDVGEGRRCRGDVPQYNMNLLEQAHVDTNTSKQRQE